jgi:hypothetical protein
MLDRGIDAKPLRRRLLARNDDIDPVPAPEAMVGDKEQGIGIRWEIDPNDVRLLIRDVVDEAGVLMAEAVMVLTPDM